MRAANKALHNKRKKEQFVAQFVCTHTEGQNKQLKITHLTVVALKVIVLVHRHDPEDLFTPLRHQTGGKNRDVSRVRGNGFPLHFVWTQQKCVNHQKYMRDNLIFKYASVIA